MELEVFGEGLVTSNLPTTYLLLEFVSALNLTPKYVFYCHKQPSQLNLEWTQLYRFPRVCPSTIA